MGIAEFLGVEIAVNLNTLLIGLLVPILGVLSPLLLAKQINKHTLAVKKQDWERQDEITARAEAAVKLAADDAKRAANKADRVETLVVQTSRTTHSQLKKIHKLVNSHLTKAIHNELTAIRETVTLMHERIKNYQENGIEPTLEELAMLRGREQKVKDLEEVLRIREEGEVNVYVDVPSDRS